MRVPCDVEDEIEELEITTSSDLLSRDGAHDRHGGAAAWDGICRGGRGLGRAVAVLLCVGRRLGEGELPDDDVLGGLLLAQRSDADGDQEAHAKDGAHRDADARPDLVRVRVRVRVGVRVRVRVRLRVGVRVRVRVRGGPDRQSRVVAGRREGRRAWWREAGLGDGGHRLDGDAERGGG